MNPKVSRSLSRKFSAWLKYKRLEAAYNRARDAFYQARSTPGFSVGTGTCADGLPGHTFQLGLGEYVALLDGNLDTPKVVTYDSGSDRKQYMAYPAVYFGKQQGAHLWVEAHTEAVVIGPALNPPPPESPELIAAKARAETLSAELDAALVAVSDASLSHRPLSTPLTITEPAGMEHTSPAE